MTILGVSAWRIIEALAKNVLLAQYNLAMRKLLFALAMEVQQKFGLSTR